MSTQNPNQPAVKPARTKGRRASASGTKGRRASASGTVEVAADEGSRDDAGPEANTKL